MHPLEHLARQIEVTFLPAYNEASAEITPTVKLSEVYADIERIVKMVREFTSTPTA